MKLWHVVVGFIAFILSIILAFVIFTSFVIWHPIRPSIRQKVATENVHAYMKAQHLEGNAFCTDDDSRMEGAVSCEVRNLETNVVIANVTCRYGTGLLASKGCKLKTSQGELIVD